MALFEVVYLLIFFALIGCSSKSSEIVQQENEGVVGDITIITVGTAISTPNGKVLNIEVERKDLVIFEAPGDAVLGEYEIEDFADGKMLLMSGNSLFVYEMPSGKFVQKLSKRGEGRDEYRNVAAAVLASDGGNIAVVESRWQDLTSKIKKYDRGQNAVGQISLPFVGDLVRMHNGEGFVAPKAISHNGGASKIYHLNESFEIIDSLDLNKQYAKGKAFNVWDSVDKLSQEPEVILRDTLFHITPDFQLIASLCLDYEGKGMPEGFSRSNYDNYDSYLRDYAEMIIPTQLQELGGMLFARLENNGKVYYSIWNAETGKLIYSCRATDAEWGFTLRIGETEFKQWPIGEMNGRLIFYLPDYIMSEVTDNEDANPGLALVEVDKVRNILKK